LALDGAGNVYVTGFSVRSDYPELPITTTLKYDARGNQSGRPFDRTFLSTISHGFGFGHSGNAMLRVRRERFWNVKYDANGYERWYVFAILLCRTISGIAVDPFATRCWALVGSSGGS